MSMTSRRTAGVLATVIAMMALGLPALAEEEQPADPAELEIELRPAVVRAGGPFIVAAEYDWDDATAPVAETSTAQAEEETATAVPGRAPVTFTIDFGDGSGQQDMRTHGAGRAAPKAKARAMHRYAEDGEYLVTVTATPALGAPLVETATAQVGRGSARLSGGSRLETATRVSRDAFPSDGSAGAVLLARSDAFADALAAASLAFLEDAPVLLTDSAEVSAGVLEEITRALGGAGTVYLLGGEVAIAPSVAEALAAAGHDVHRIAGDDRIDTAVQIAQFLIDAGVEVDQVVLASAAGFADALAGAAFAAEGGAPVLLTAADALDPRVAALLQQLGDVEVLVAGGELAVSDVVVGQVAAMGLEVQRLSGPDRFATSAAVAEALFDDAHTVVVATGANFPDALAGAAHAGRLHAPVLLVGDVLPPAVAEYLRARAGQIDVVYILGGGNAVSQDVMDEIEALLGLDG